MNDRELIAGLNLCRPGADDLQHPELADVAKQVASDPRAQAIHVRIDRIDTTVRAAMHEVTLPTGFETRLLSRIRDAMADQTDASSSTAAKSNVTSQPQAPTVVSRRRWLAWSTGAAATAATVAAVIFALRDTPLDEDQLHASSQWHDALIAKSKWLELGRDNLGDHTFPSELRWTPRRYCDATSVVGRDAYAYDLTTPGGPAATLFVIQQEDNAHLSASAPLEPHLRTQGYSIAYWQRDDAIYVVVVESDRVEDYRMLLRTSVPLAA
jgi:hypothetical protein